MKRVSWILTLPLALIAVAFAIANRQSVTLDLWPFQLAVGPLPFFVWFLGALFMGILTGGMAVWLTGRKVRRRARSAERRARELERELAAQRAGRMDIAADPGPAPTPGPESGKNQDRGLGTRKGILPMVGL